MGLKMSNWFAVGLTNTKHAESVLRVMGSIHNHNGKLLMLEGQRFEDTELEMEKKGTQVPLVWGIKVLPGCKVVVVERTNNARDIRAFPHPARATYIFGPEDGDVPANWVDIADKVIQIPTKTCMALPSAVDVVLYDRMLKQWHKKNSQLSESTPEKQGE